MSSDQSNSFNYDSVAGFWETWEKWLEPCYLDLNQELLERANVEDGRQILDLGCGSGYPSIQAARIAPHGKVTALDVSSEMLRVARRRAETLNLTNIEFIQQDMDSLPFPDDSFDCVTARFSLMFVDHPLGTLKEVRRVLKTNGAFAACVWSSYEKNPLPARVLKKYHDIPVSHPDVKGSFRFAGAGVLARLMQAAGFGETREVEIHIKEVFLDGNQYIQHLLESSVMWGSLLLKLQSDLREEAIQALKVAAEEYRSGDHIEIPRCALLLSTRV